MTGKSAAGDFDRSSRGRRSPLPESGIEAIEPPSLEAVLDTLGPGILETWAAPRGLSAVIRRAVIFDPDDEPDLAPGDLVLLPGIHGGSLTPSWLIRECGRAEVAAVAMKIGTRLPDPRDVVMTAERSGVALLGANPRITWAQLHILIRTVMAGTGQPVDSVVDAPFGDLFALANAVARTVGGPVTIEDPRSQVLAFSNVDEPVDEPRRATILGRQVPDAWVRRLRDAGVIKRLWSSGDVVHVEESIPAGELRPRRAIAVRAGDEMLGSIWVAQGSKPFGRGADKALREAAHIAALHLIRYRAVDRLHDSRQTDDVRALLSGTGSSPLLAERLDLKPSADYIVLLVEPVKRDAPDSVRERLTRMLGLYGDAYRRRAATALIGRYTHVLLPIRSHEDIDRYVVGAIEHVAQAIGLDIRVAVGGLVGNIREVHLSRADAEQVMRVLRNQGGPGAATIDQTRTDVILLELRDHVDDLTQLRYGKVQRLAVHDQQYRTRYVETLRVFLASFGSISKAAAATHVHPNTFRYRIQRAVEIAEIDLDDPDDRFATELQLRLLLSTRPDADDHAGRSKHRRARQASATSPANSRSPHGTP